MRITVSIVFDLTGPYFIIYSQAFKTKITGNNNQPNSPRQSPYA